MEHRKLYSAKRVLSFALFTTPIVLTFLWDVKYPTPYWDFESLGISWQVIAIFVSFMAMAAWGFVDKKGTWD